MAYRVYYEFGKGEWKDVMDCVFMTKKAAEEAAVEGVMNNLIGGDVLRGAGGGFCEGFILGWAIVEE